MSNAKTWIGFVGLAVLAHFDLRAQSSDPIVFSANNSADYSTTIAQGSLFVVFGFSLGPATLVQVSTFPLPNMLSGTSVTVTSGASTLNYPMVYASNGQVAAILPSNTPVGPASVTVAIFGETDPNGYSTTPITVAESSTGLYTSTESGLGAGIFTTPGGTLETFSHSAKPGDVVTAWATGLGPIRSPDNILPTSFPNFPNVQVWVAGQSAQVLYAGRSGCCAALDQIDFMVPAVANGCNVPVVVVSGGSSSNTVTLPVSASGGTCTDSGPSVPASILTKADAGQPVKVAAIAIGPIVFGNRAAAQEALAKRLSRAFHTRVSEADAARLMRAYAANNPRAIRRAMFKYASRWKALDARTKASIIVQIGQTQEGAAAFFGLFGSEGTAAMIGSAQLPVAGSCIVLPKSYPSGVGSVSSGLDAGPSLSLTGAAGSVTLKEIFNRNGQYHAAFAASVTGSNVPLGSYTISGSGGNDVGAFSAKIIVASHLAISNKPSLATIDRTQPLTVTWTGGVAGNYVLIGAYAPSNGPSGISMGNPFFACTEDAGKGAFTIPSYILSAVNATGNAKGVLAITPNPLSNQIAIPGIDLAYFIDGSNDTTNVTFR
jgi:uncharacterized protein (TIGR03437 family)